MGTIMHTQVKTRGRIPLPKAWCPAYHIKTGDLISLSELGNGVILLCAQPTRASHLADKFADKLHKAGAALPNLLEELRQLRK